MKALGFLAKCLKNQRKALQVVGVRRLGSAAQAKVDYEPGQSLHGYTVRKVVPVPELHLTAVDLIHSKTGAQHLHVCRDDTENAFGVTFRTTPMDSTGVPHILEHTALCGSDKFPVRDPFFKMLNRSLATFMNAFTASDWTMYPFSTQNSQDFQNLLQVYLDAAFFPRLREEDFRQEGWRLEHEDITNPESSIVFKGIVFNEMKGVFSNSQQLYVQHLQNLLLPSHTYSVISGGHPQHIPDLTWQNLRDFHKTHYHPSNARFFTYGDIDLENHLKMISTYALDEFSSIDPGTEVPVEKRWTEPREAEVKCSPNPMAPDPSKQTTVTVSYLLNDVTDAFESFVMSFIGALLTHGETAPFYKSLIEPNIGSDFAPALGYEGETREAFFSVGLEGVHRDDVRKVCDIVDQTFDSVIRDGFDQKRIDMMLHKIEIGQRHVYNKFGINLGLSLISGWIHGADPTLLLQTNQHVARFKQCLQEDPHFLQHKLQHYFKDNTHKLTLVMNPDEEFERRRQEEEEAKLAAMLSRLSPQDKDRIFKDGVSLVEQQNEEEDLSCLPSLQVSDIPPQLPAVTTNTLLSDGVSLQLCEQPTNGVTYFRAVSGVRDLDPHLKPYLPLFCGIVTKMGAGEMGYSELSQAIELSTGSMSASTLIHDHHTLPHVYEEGVLFSSFCLDRNVSRMFDLWTEIFQRLDLSDKERLQTLIMMTAADLAQSLSGSGHVYAMTHAASQLSPTANLRENLTGMSQVALMKSVSEMRDLQTVISHLQQIAAHVLNRTNLRVSLNSTPEAMPDVVKDTTRFLTQLNRNHSTTTDVMTEDEQFVASRTQTHFELPFQVNFMSRSVKTVPYTHEDFASLRVLARLMTNKYLHREIREKGGAYGGGASSNSPGILNFYSYRDPNSMKTLEAFDGAVDWAQAGSFSQQDVDEAKLAIFQQVDGPVTPGDCGQRLFLTRITDEMRQTHREQLFAVTRPSLTAAAHRYLSETSRETAVTFLGPENEASRSSNEWVVRRQ